MISARNVDSAEAIDRRVFLARAAAFIPLVHVGGLALPGAHAMTHEPPSTDFAATARFSRLRLHTHVIDEMAEFYRTTLGLPVEPNKESGISITCGQTIIDFVKAAPSTQPFYHFAFNIPHNKLDKAIEWMKPRHPLFVRDDGNVVFHFDRWDAHAIYFVDPSGNVVEFIARHSLRNDAHGDFGVNDILCASEIGVVTPNVAATATELKEGLKLNDYKHHTDGFHPVGDEHGLFIVFNLGRTWLTSNRSTEVFPAHAHVRDNLNAPIQIELAHFEVNPA